MMHIQCACGAEFEVAEVYAGGQVHCHACGATVLVPADQAEDDKFRFQCPHCKARVVGRKSSAGKKSQCPACEQIYIVPDPPSESVSPLPKESRRIELSTDDLALRIGLPFAVGKLEPPIAAPPQPRYVHSPFDRPDDGQQFEPLHTMAVPVQHQAETTKLDLRADRSAPSVAPGPQQDDQQTTTFLAAAPSPLASRPPASPSQAAAPPEWARTHGSPSSVTSSSAATAAAMPQMTAPTKPASVGELQIVTGNHCGERIRLDFHRFLIGAERDCDMRPTSPLLSRHHCVFKKDEYSLRIRDLGSMNGTFVNGRRIFTEAILKPGDVVRIADVTFQVHLPRPPQVIQAAPDSSPSISDFVIL
jgi:pSer/pThr/pTyr-binding forkhead associated (FHA) protein